MRFALLSLFFLTALGGCKDLFGLSDSSDTADASLDGSTDGAIPTAFHGQLCLLTDLRDYRSCTALVAEGLNVTIVGALNATTLTDAAGQFTITLPPLDLGADLTLRVTDGKGTYVSTAANFARTVTGTIALPVLAAETDRQLRLDNGVPEDDTRGTSFAYMVDSQGVPVPQVKAALRTDAFGPFYDGSATNELGVQNATSTHGLVAFFALPTGTLTFQLQTPSGKSYTLPILGGTTTISTYPVE